MTQPQDFSIAEVVIEGILGVQLRLRLQPNSSQDGLKEVCPEHIRWAVREKALDGLANKALIKSLSDMLDLPKSSISIRRGLRSRNKVVFLAGVNKEQILERICSSSP